MNNIGTLPKVLSYAYTYNKHNFSSFLCCLYPFLSIPQSISTSQTWHLLLGQRLSQLSMLLLSSSGLSYLLLSSNVTNCLYFRSNIPIPFSYLTVSLSSLPLVSSSANVHTCIITIACLFYLLYTHSFFSCDIDLLIIL